MLIVLLDHYLYPHPPSVGDAISLKCYLDYLFLGQLGHRGRSVSFIRLVLTVPLNASTKADKRREEKECVKRIACVLVLKWLHHLCVLFCSRLPPQSGFVVRPLLVFGNRKAEFFTVDRPRVLPFCASSPPALFSRSSHVYSQQACSSSLARPPTHQLAHTQCVAEGGL